MFRAGISALMVAVCLVAVAPAAGPLDPEIYTDGFNPATDSYQINEAQRREQIARQLGLNRYLIWSAGHGLQSPPVQQPVGHETLQTGPNRWLYRPVYEFELLPAPVVRPAPANSVRPAQSVKIDPPRPSDARPEDFVPPVPVNRKPLPVGRREF